MGTPPGGFQGGRQPAQEHRQGIGTAAACSNACVGAAARLLARIGLFAAATISADRNNCSLDVDILAREEMMCNSCLPTRPLVQHRAQRIMCMDYRARRLRNTLLLGTAFLAGVTIGPASGLIARHFLRSLSISAAFAQDTDRANTYRLLTLFGDVFEKVRSQYVDPVSDKELVENAINGMLTGLDPHSAYMNADQFREMKVETTGEFGGLGIEVIPENGFFKVISALDDTPASKAGIKAGDIVTGLNGKTTRGLSPDDCARPDARPPEYQDHVDHQA